MNPHLWIAYRHLRSKHHFSFVSLIGVLSIMGMAIGVAVLILTLAILSGFQSEVQSKIISFDGHIRITGLMEKPVPEKDPFLDSVLASVPAIIEKAPYIHKPAMLRFKNQADGVFVEAIDSHKASSVFGITQLVKQGTFSYETRHGGSNGIVIGEKLAERIGASLGDLIVLFDLESLGKTGKPIRLKQFEITGMYSTGLYEYDNTLVYINLKEAQTLFGYENQLTGEILKTADALSAVTIARELDGLLGYSYYPSSWKERHYDLFAWLSVQKYPVMIIFGLIALVAIMNITSSLTLIVMEKTRDIGILKSFGFTRKEIARIFLVEGLGIGIAGVLIGIVISLCVGYSQIHWRIIHIPEDIYFMNFLPVMFELRHFVIIALLGLVFAGLSAVYPAWKASAIHPAEALRYE